MIINQFSKVVQGVLVRVGFRGIKKKLKIIKGEGGHISGIQWVIQFMCPEEGPRGMKAFCGQARGLIFRNGEVFGYIKDLKILQRPEAIKDASQIKKVAPFISKPKATKRKCSG
ncbi:MAG: hypothetical protein RMI63_00840 [Caldimicrobium sp.]|nr:hypothetical protein [Caldimicrobium sp.]MDW8093555.1 hypothetical protein [Caldimicrobium sp.]